MLIMSGSSCLCQDSPLPAYCGAKVVSYWTCKTQNPDQQLDGYGVVLTRLFTVCHHDSIIAEYFSQWSN